MIENLTGTVRYTCMNFQSFVLSIRLMTLWLIRCLMYMYRVSFIENKCLLNNGRKIWSILLCTSSFIIIWIYYYNNSAQYIWTSELIGFLQSNFSHFWENPISQFPSFGDKFVWYIVLMLYGSNERFNIERRTIPFCNLIPLKVKTKAVPNYFLFINIQHMMTWGSLSKYEWNCLRRHFSSFKLLFCRFRVYLLI